MGTFEQYDNNAAAAQSSVDKDNPTPEEIKAADDAITSQTEVPANDPNKPTEILEESEEEAADRHVASTELPVRDLLPEDQQEDSSLAEDAKDLIVPGAAAGPDRAGVIRNDHGHVAYAPPGTHNAAMAGVQEDASGRVDSIHTDNSSKSGTRI